MISLKGSPSAEEKNSTNVPMKKHVPPQKANTEYKDQGSMDMGNFVRVIKKLSNEVTNLNQS